MEAKTKKNYDLTSGPILNKILLVALPIMGTQLMQMFYNLTDMFWLGRLSSEAVAASGTGGMYLWLSQAFMMVGRMGSEIGVSQSFGAGKRDEARRYGQTALMLAVLLGGGVGLGMSIFRTPLVALFNIQDPAVAQDSVTYLGLVGLGVLPTFIASAIGGIFVGAGNSRTPFHINAIGLVLNMVLDPLLIFTFSWGIAGAAIATTVAQVVMAIIFLFAIKLNKNRPFERFRFRFKPRGRHVKQIFKWSGPIVLESALFTALSTVISRYVNGLGTPAMTVQRVGGQIESLSWLVGGGFASAVTAFVGQNFGARRWKRIHKGVRLSIYTMLVYGVLVTLLLFFGGGFFFGLFLEDPELIAMGAEAMKILAACQLVACLEYNSAGVFRGLGRTLPPSIVTTVGNLVRIPIVFWFGERMGLMGIWWGITVGALLRGVWMFGWFLWMNKRLPKRDGAL